MVNQPNTIYEIRYDFDLDGKTLEIPENCVMKFEGGSLLNGKIIGNETYIQAIQIKIFSDVCLLGDYINERSYVEWFGAISDDSYTIDSSKYIQYALDNTPINSTLIFKNNYYSSTELVLNNRGIDIYMTGRLYFDKDTNGLVLKAVSDSNNNIQNHTYRLNIYKKAPSYNEDEYGGAKTYGLLLEGIRQATFDVFIANFEGAICLRSTKDLDCTYNKVFIRTIFNCTKSIVLDSITYDSDTTVAQNTFFGGRIGISGDFTKRLETANKTYNPFISLLGKNNTNNNNGFFGVSFEGAGVIVLDLYFCLFSICRFEGIKKITSDKGDYCLILASYGLTKVDISDNISHFNTKSYANLYNYGGPLKLYTGTTVADENLLSGYTTTRLNSFNVSSAGVVTLSSLKFKANKYIPYADDYQFELYVGSAPLSIDLFQKQKYILTYNTANMYFCNKAGQVSKMLSARSTKDGFDIKGDMIVSNGLPIFCLGNKWVFADGAEESTIRNGNTDSRPNKNNIYVGFQYFDTTLNKPIWWTGRKWVDATGADI